MALLRDAIEEMESESAWKLWSDAAIVHPPSLLRRRGMSLPGGGPQQQQQQQHATYVSSSSSGFLPRTCNSMYNINNDATTSASNNAKAIADILARNEREFGSTRSVSTSYIHFSKIAANKTDVWKEALRKQGLLTSELEEAMLMKDSRQDTTTNTTRNEETRLGAVTHDEWLEDTAELMLLKNKIKMVYAHQEEEESSQLEDTVKETIHRSYRSLERDPEKEWQEIQNMLQVANKMPTLAGGENVNQDDKNQAAETEKENEETHDEGIEPAGRSTPSKYTSVNDGTDPQVVLDDDDDDDVNDNESATKSIHSVPDAEKRLAQEASKRQAVKPDDSYSMKMIQKLLSWDKRQGDVWLRSRDSFDQQAPPGGKETMSERLIRMMKNMDSCLFDSKFCHECGGVSDDDLYADPSRPPPTLSTTEAASAHDNDDTTENKKPKEGGMYSFLERMTSPSDAMVVATLVRGKPSSSHGDGGSDARNSASTRGDNTTKSRRVHFRMKNSMSYSSESSAATSVSSSSTASSVSSSQYDTEVILESQGRSGGGGSKYSSGNYINYDDRNDDYHNDADGSSVSYVFEGDEVNTRRRKKESKKYRNTSATEHTNRRPKQLGLQAIQQSLPRFRRRSERR